jgi:peptidoglycan/LPS O-acetylase OafA/YrhL
MKNQPEHYRQDLQGVRAIAVFAVVLYHAGFAWTPGGYVGVDMFFVLSGFFITGKLLREVNRTGRVDLVLFWTQRAKRLLPNAAVTLLFVLISAAVLLPSYRREAIASDVVSAALFFSNYHFAESAVDYFTANDPESPMLHFWSLSVEEQFYFVWPMLLAVTVLLLPARRTVAMGLLALIFAGSFAHSLQALGDSQPAAFFRTENRVWQLAAGGLLAANFELLMRLPRNTLASLGWVGAAAIAGAIAIFSDDLRYPGGWALIPTFGSLAVILGAGPSLRLRQALSCTPLVWLGYRSYSLYLWHWPLLALAAEACPQVPKTAIVLAGLLIASVSYAAVERPLHYGKVSRIAIVGSAVGCLATLLAIAHVVKRLPQPTAVAARSAEVKRASQDDSALYQNGCHRSYDQTDHASCVFGTRGAAHRVVLFGDSHAAQWFEPLRKAATAEGWELRASTKTSCPFISTTIWYPKRKVVYDECTTWREGILSQLEATKPDLVVLASLSDYSGWLFNRKVIVGSGSADAWVEGALATIDRLQAAGIKVALISDNPHMYKSYRSCLSSSDGPCARDRSDALGYAVRESRLIEERRPSVRLLDFTDQFCGQDSCPARRAGVVIYRDEHHLTSSFASTFAPAFGALLSEEESSTAGAHLGPPLGQP